MAYRKSERSRRRRQLILSRQRPTAVDVATLAKHRAAFTAEFLTETLHGERPATWVVTGEQVADEGGVTVADRLEDRVVRRWGRREDRVVSTAQRGDRLGSLAMTLDSRVFRHDPTAAIVVVGACDPRDDRRESELDALATLLHDLDDGGVATVVLPPTPRGVGESLTLNTADETLRRDVEQTAAACGAVVVPTAECDSPALLATSLFKTLGLDRGRPRRKVEREPATV